MKSPGPWRGHRRGATLSKEPSVGDGRWLGVGHASRVESHPGHAVAGRPPASHPRPAGPPASGSGGWTGSRSGGSPPSRAPRSRRVLLRWRDPRGCLHSRRIAAARHAGRAGEHVVLLDVDFVTAVSGGSYMASSFAILASDGPGTCRRTRRVLRRNVACGPTPATSSRTSGSRPSVPSRSSTDCCST